MQVSDEIKNRVNARLAECVAKSGIDTGKIIVKYDINSARLGGEAHAAANVIRLNPVFLNAYTDHYIETTVAHEWAHLATRKVHGYGVSSHGPEWKQMMINIGVPPARCHNYEVPKGMNVGKQRQKYQIVCDCCGEEMECGAKVFAKIQNGARYTHKRCGGVIKVMGRIINKPAQPVVTKPAQKAAQVPATKPATGSTKMEQCKAIFVTMTAAGAARKEIIEAFVSQIGMTNAGASTYYQNIKKAMA